MPDQPTKPDQPANLEPIEWNHLINNIQTRQVIPILGPELMTVPDGDREIPLVRWLSPRLARALKLPDPEHYTALNEVACAYLCQPKKNRGLLYSEILTILKEARLQPSEALLSLASITDFDLYISTTFDPLLAMAMAQTRRGFDRAKDVLAYATNRATPFPDPLPKALVYHILGSLQTTPNFVVWEEDYLEFLCRLTEQSHDTALEGLFRLLKERHLLLLGAPFGDWSVRFFLRAARGRRLTGARDSDSTEILNTQQDSQIVPEVFYFDKLVDATRVVPDDAIGFVAELTRRWREANNATWSTDDFHARMKGEMPRDAVFISYSRDDEAAATQLAMTLAAANIPVWLDRTRLEAGQNYERQLETAVRESCSFFISLISRATEDSSERYVHKERAWAAKRHRDGFVFYLPLLLEGTPDPKLEPECFSRIHREVLPANGTPSDTFIHRLRDLVEKRRQGDFPRD